MKEIPLKFGGRIHEKPVHVFHKFIIDLPIKKKKTPGLIGKIMGKEAEEILDARKPIIERALFSSFENEELRNSTPTQPLMKDQNLFEVELTDEEGKAIEEILLGAIERSAKLEESVNKHNSKNL